MNPKKSTGFLLILVVFTLLSCSGNARKTDLQNFENIKATIHGTVAFMRNLGGYFIRGENPPSEYFIVNQDLKLLEELHRTQKRIVVEGHFTIGADHLFIEKIDGKKYRGKEPTSK